MHLLWISICMLSWLLHLCSRHTRYVVRRKNLYSKGIYYIKILYTSSITIPGLHKCAGHLYESMSGSRLWEVFKILHSGPASSFTAGRTCDKGMMSCVRKIPWCEIGGFSFCNCWMKGTSSDCRLSSWSKLSRRIWFISDSMLQSL